MFSKSVVLILLGFFSHGKDILFALRFRSAHMSHVQFMCLPANFFFIFYIGSNSPCRSCDGLSDCKVFVFLEEKHLLLHFIKIISKSDPDILVGWDVQGGSIGFLAERASYLGIGLLNLISRTPTENKIVGNSEHLNEGELENVHPDSLMTDSGLVEETVIEDEWGRTHASGVHVGGRIVLNLWRVMRCEVKLNLYTLEAVAEAVLRKKTPSIQHRILTKWFASGSGCARYRCIEYLIKRTKLNLQIMDQLDLVLSFELNLFYQVKRTLCHNVLVTTYL